MTRGDAPASAMTIREAFAMAAIEGLVANHRIHHGPDAMALIAAGFADALLAELERTSHDS